MEKCKATLEEHAQWSQLVRETKSILEGGGRLSDSADRWFQDENLNASTITSDFFPIRIEAMFRSLDILKNLPGNEERQETCESFKESMLNALRPRVRRDILAADLSPLQEYLYVFQKLGRLTFDNFVSFHLVSFNVIKNEPLQHTVNKLVLLYITILLSFCYEESGMKLN